MPEQKITPAGAKVTAGGTEQKMQKSGSAGTMLLLFLVLGIAVLGTLFYFQKGQVLNNTTQLEKDAVALQSQIDEVKSTKVEFSKNATDALAKIQAEEIRWSEVIEQINQLLPKDANGARKVNVLSYSGSGTGRVAVNVVTVPSGEPAYGDVAQMIATFNNSLYFRDVYVPSISRGSDEEGLTSLSFVLNMDFEKPETGAEDLSLTPTDDASVKVPRNR